jgi:MFS family permease
LIFYLRPVSVFGVIPRKGFVVVPSTMSPPRDGALGRTPQQGAVLITCPALGTVVAAMASLNVALPDVARPTHPDQTRQSWVVDAHSLMVASLLLSAGAFGDPVGRRLELVAGLIIFATGSDPLAQDLQKCGGVFSRRDTVASCRRSQLNTGKDGLAQAMMLFLIERLLGAEDLS